MAVIVVVVIAIVVVIVFRVALVTAVGAFEVIGISDKWC